MSGFRDVILLENLMLRDPDCSGVYSPACRPLPFVAYPQSRPRGATQSHLCLLLSFPLDPVGDIPDPQHAGKDGLN